MKGWQLASAERFAVAFDPVMGEFAQRHWIVDLQSGPFSITERPDCEALAQEIERFSIPCPAVESRSATVWRRGIFPAFSEFLVHDEWSYLVGAIGTEKQACQLAQAIISVPVLEAAWFEVIEAAGAVACVLGEPRDTWELYGVNDVAGLHVHAINSARWNGAGAKHGRITMQ